MTQHIPISLQHRIIEYFQLNGNDEVSLIDFSYAPGGCINQGGKLTTSKGILFLKWNDLKSYPGMFEAEAEGLAILSKTKTLRVPDVVTTGEAGNFQFILMEFLVAEKQHESYWTELGIKLAGLHKNSNNSFGLDHDNYIGSLPQLNTRVPTWVEFFTNYRLSPQVERLRNSTRIDRQFVRRLETLYLKLGEIVPEEMPSLLHGDLWSGNVIAGPKGAAYAIDPAIYYGHREAELAFTKLFGGFEISFYEAYEDHFQLQPGFEQRYEVYNLYPLLVHANLFGQSYLGQVQAILSKYA